MRKYKAALIGYYGFKNLGDELLLKASLEMLTRNGIKPSEILILSNSPSETSAASEPKAISRWSLSNLIKAFMNCERLIFGGGLLLLKAELDWIIIRLNLNFMREIYFNSGLKVHEAVIYLNYLNA